MIAERPDYAALVERLRRPHTAAGCGCLCCTAADAIEALLRERKPIIVVKPPAPAQGSTAGEGGGGGG